MHDVELAEVSVIGSILLDNRVLPKIAHKITSDDFSIEACAKVYEAAVDAMERGKAFDAVVAVDVLGRSMGNEAKRFILDCAEITPTTTNAVEYAELVKKNSGLRQLRAGVEDALLMANDPDTVAGDIIGLCQGYLTGNRTNRIKTLADALTAMYEEKTSGSTLRIDTGLGKLDWLLKGLCGGNLVVVAARPGMGKSAIGIQIARHAAAHGNKTAFFSMEMQDLEVAERLVARSGLDMDKLIDNKLTDDDWKSFGDAANKLSKLPLYIIDEPHMSVARIRATARSIPDLKLIVVDYLTLLKSNKRSEKRYLEIGEMTRELKVLASEMRIPVVVLSQLSRNKDETEEPTLRDLRESGDIEQDANKVIMLWKLDEELPEGAPLRIGCKVAKNRRGKQGVVVLRFDGAHMTFTELEERYTPPKRKRGLNLE